MTWWQLELETKAMTTSSQCNTGRICVTLPIITTEKILPAYTRCSENLSNTCAENQKNSRFEIWYSVLAPSGGVWKKLNIGAQLHIIPYKKPTKDFFFKLHGLIDFRCAQTFAFIRALLVPPVRTWQFFVPPCNEVAKYFYMGAHL